MTRSSPRREASAIAKITLRLLLAAVFVATTVGLPLDAAAQPIELDIVDADTSGRDVTLTVVAPIDLRQDLIDDSSFLISVGGTAVTPSVERVAGDELDVVLLVDVSGSMTAEALDAAKVAGAAFINQLPTRTRVAVVSFGDEATVVQPFTTDFSSAISELEGLQAAGETALYAAVVEAARQFDPTADSIRTVVLLSDGGNTVDESSLGAAQAALIATESTLYAISIETTELNPAELEALASANGGTVERVEQVEAIESIYRAIAVDLSNQYRLRFEAPGEGPTQTLIQAVTETEVIAEATLGLTLPVAPTPAPSSTPLPAAAPTPVPEPVVATSPSRLTIDAPTNSLLKWASISAVSGAIAIIAMLILVPGESRAPRVKPIQRIAQRQSDNRGVRLVVDNLTGLVERLLSGRRSGLWLSTVLDTAGWKLRNSEFIVLVGLIAVVAFFAGAISSISLGITLAFIVLASVAVILVLLVTRRRAAFAEQLNGTLQMMAGALRTGYSLPQVFALVAEESEAPTSEEFSRVVVEVRLGRDLVDATMGVAERMNNEDFAWATGAIDISREIGGDLAEVLDNVAATIRTRARVRRQILALSAEGRVSAWILMILPFPMFFWQLLVNREYTLLLFTTGLGRTIFFTAVVLLVIGAIWMRRLIELKF